jgi:hypothetical protein
MPAVRVPQIRRIPNPGAGGGGTKGKVTMSKKKEVLLVVVGVMFCLVAVAIYNVRKNRAIIQRKRAFDEGGKAIGQGDYENQGEKNKAECVGPILT